MWADPARNLTLWTEAMRAKYMGEGAPWGRRELDVVLGEFDVPLPTSLSLSLPFDSSAHAPTNVPHPFKPPTLPSIAPSNHLTF